MLAVRATLCPLLLLAGAVSRGAAQQDSVIILRGATATTGAHFDNEAARPSWESTLPDFLTPAECSRLVAYRDGPLARDAIHALNTIEIDADAAVDLRRARDQLAHDLNVADLTRLLAAMSAVNEQTVAEVRRAFKLASLLSTPEGAPKSVGEIVKDIADATGKEAADAVVEGRTLEYRQRLAVAASDLEGALRRLIEESTFIQHLKGMPEAEAEVRRMREQTLPELDRQIASFRVAVREANRTLRSDNEQVAQIDAATRKACR